MGDDGPKARVLDGRALAVAGKHRVTGSAVIRFLPSDGTNDRHLVRDAGEVAEVFIEHDAGNLRLGDAERTAVFERSLGLRIPRFLVSHAAGQHDLNHALRDAFFARVVLQVCSGLHGEVIAECEAERADHADAEEVATACGQITVRGRHAKAPCLWKGRSVGSDG